jgi:hypothetical protein
MKLVSLLLAVLLIAPQLANADLVELVKIYGPSGGDEFYHVCGPGDVNGDGYDDFIISSPIRDRSRHECENGYARLYFGGDPIDTSNYITIPAVCDQPQYAQNEFGAYCTGAGYINGDSYPDFLIGDPWYDFNWQGPWFSGGGFVYWGGPVIDTLPGLRLVAETFNSWSKFYGLGDVNGDFFDDIVASTHWTDDSGPVNIYLGGESPDSIPDFQIWPFFGQYPVLAEPAKIVGDYNGDGKDDIVFCNHVLGIAYMFFGSENGFSEPDLLFGTEGTGDFGQVLSGCGDLNDDSYDDFVAADWHTAYVYFGSENPDTVADLILVDDQDTLSPIGWLASGADLNMDGFNDVAMSNPWWSDITIQAGRVFIYYGGVEMDSLPDTVICGEDRFQRFGIETAFPGDINGDGYPEFLVSSANNSYPGYSFITVYTTNTSSTGDQHPHPSARTMELASYPNPFNASTVISYSLPVTSHVRLEVFNLAGQKIASLVDEIQSPGRRSVTWEGLDDRGQPASSGIYFCKISSHNLTKTEKMALLR